MIKSRGLKLLEEEIKKRDREIKAWRGVGPIPKKLKQWEKDEFVEAQVGNFDLRNPTVEGRFHGHCGLGI